jgi:YHS domain-containing protein
MAQISSRWIISAALFVPLAACGAEHRPQSTTATVAALKAPGEASIGDKTVCLVSKEEFTVSASSPRVEYKGKSYFFCCAGCDTEFKKNPEKYLSGGGT